MKEFLKYTMASMLGFFLSCILMSIICIVSIAAMIASSESYSEVEDHSIMRLRLNGTIEEQKQDDKFLAMLTGGQYSSLALDETLIALKKAADNKKVQGIYMEGGILSCTPAQAQELRQALVEFKKSGKWIIAYGEQYSKSAYYLCSVADSIYMNPEGALDWSGMSSQPIFFKGLMEKVGVKMQVFKVGTYKSAVEPYICDSMSVANREQVNSFLSDVWDGMLTDVSESRSIEKEALNALADSLTYISLPQASVDGKLVDRLCYKDEIKSILKQRAGVDEDESLTFAEVGDVANCEMLNDKHDDEIAVYYAVGEIVSDGADNMSSESVITAAKMTKDLQELGENKDVKAVVIRVNSPGGSAYASEQIWRSVELLKAKKPVIISMGGYAASGGYYISCAANKIIAEPSTLTGSIGIFGMIPDASELLTQKLGLSFDVVKTNAMSDLGAMGRPFNESESNLMQQHINRGYDTFTKRVADGRGISQDSVKVIAEGRVWTGNQALKIGLVDQLGNLDTAIEEAAKAANITEYGVRRITDERSIFDMFSDAAGPDYLEDQMRSTLGEYYTALSFLRNIKQRDPIQARLPFEPNIK